MTTYCMKCGSEIPEGNKFCLKCGTPINEVGKNIPLASPISTEPEPYDDTTDDLIDIPLVMPVPPEPETQAMPSVSIPSVPVNSPEQNNKNGNNAIVIVIIVGIAVIAVILIIALILMPMFNNPASEEAENTEIVVPEEEIEEDSQTYNQQPTQPQQSQQQQTQPQPQQSQQQQTQPQQQEEFNKNTMPSGQESKHGVLATKVDVPYSGFILPQSQDEYITESDIQNLSNEELYIARNEIFARYGREFANQDLQDWFNGFEWWYKPTYTPEQFDSMPTPLNDIELANLETIRQLEAKRNSPYTV